AMPATLAMESFAPYWRSPEFRVQLFHRDWQKCQAEFRRSLKATAKNLRAPDAAASSAQACVEKFHPESSPIFRRLQNTSLLRTCNFLCALPPYSGESCV